MCGIIGVFNNPLAGKLVVKGLKVMQNRGRDGFGISNAAECEYSKKNSQLKQVSGHNILGHCLHSIVGHVRQPIEGVLSANCEIYNWQELREKYKFKAENDTEVLFSILKMKGFDSLQELDGVFAFCHWKGKEVTIARDIIGEKPVWYSHSQGFAFASEKKALENMGYTDVVELNPRELLRYDIEKDKLEFVYMKFFSNEPQCKKNMKDLVRGLKENLEEAVKKRVPEKKFGLLFSGGVDSTVLATVLKQLGCKFELYTAICVDKEQKEAEDFEYAQRAAKWLGVRLNMIKIPAARVPALLKKIVPLIEDTNVTKVSVALPFYVACQKAHKDGCKVIFSGLGSEEIFAGYQRHKNSTDINLECVSGLLKIYERDLYRDDVITMYNQIELRLPFLDRNLVDYCLKIPVQYKLNEERDKIILRDYARSIGIPEEFAFRKKRAAQYGSNFMKAIEKLSKQAGCSYKSEYMRRFYPKHNLRLGALFSGGKDSAYAAYVMKRQNYELSCLITIKSTNPDSYMFHTPNIELTKLQAEAMEIPLLQRITEGIEGEELTDLKLAIDEAKEKFGIQGIVTGALFSTYQRNRIEKICDELGLKVFSPLWHINQETEMREILNQGFEFIITKIAADGLDKSWLGRPVTQKDIDNLAKLNKKNGINIAFEGGEAETMMIDGPIFRKRIEVEKAVIEMENSNTGVYKIKEVKLISR